MAWSLEGEYFENCNCKVVCPCEASMSFEADNERCQVPLICHIEHGQKDGVELDGLNFIILIDSPQIMGNGNWRVGVYIDERADESQREALETLARGEAGGPWGIFINTYELVGVHPAPFEIELADERSRLKVGDAVELQMEPIKNPVTGDETRAAVVVPKGLVFNEGWCATSTHFSVKGDIEFEHSGKNTEYAEFEYSGP